MNGLRITVIEGRTLSSDNEFFFDADHDYIVLGRDPAMCHITFAEDSKDHGIGNEHIAFKRSLGRYQIDLNTEHYVELNGSTPFEDQEITGLTRIKLGHNIHLEVEVIDQRAQAHPIGKPHIQPGAQVQRNRKILWATLPVVGCILVGLLYLNNDVSEVQESVADADISIAAALDNMDELSQQITQLESGYEEITQATIRKISQSVYLILKRDSNGGETPQGTAWVTENNRLATNAHVASAFDRLTPNEELVARASVAPYRTYRITKSVPHPGFKRYQQLWSDYLPTQKSNNRLNLMQTVTPADVALLSVENPADLGAPLTLATQQELAELQPGMKVGFVGYPVENLLPGTMQAPTPVAQQDELVRVTDFFMVKQATNTNRLIQHGLPLTGGASGSPLFNAKGHVIGLVSGVNVAPSTRGRIVNAADINFAQRVDFLYDLLNGNIATATTALEQQWTHSLQQFIPAQTGSVNAIRQNIQALFNVNKPLSTRSIRESVSTQKSFGKKKISLSKKIHFPKPGIHLVTLVSNASKPRITTTPPTGKNSSQYYRAVPYSNFAAFKLLITDEPVTITAMMSFAKPPYIKEDLNYALTIDSWQQPIEVSGKKVALSSTKTAASSVLLKQARNIQQAKKLNDHYISGFNIVMNKPGWYTFIAIPKGKGSLNAILTNSRGKVIRRDQSKNAIAMMTHENKVTTNSTISFVSYTKAAGTTQDMYVYYSPYKTP